MSRVGFHVGPGGNPTGIGDYVRRLATARLSATIVAADVTTGLSDALATAGNHTLVWRAVRDGSEQYAVPQYNLSPDDAARAYYDLIAPLCPPELDRSRVHVAIGNELDKSRADWIGWWLVLTAQLFDAAGFRVVGPNWSTGEPEYEHWQTPGMLAWLSYLATNRQHALGLHEYSLSDNLLEGAGYLVGRYWMPLEVAKEQGIAPPEIIVTEFGWRHNWVPNPSVAMKQLEQLRVGDPDYPPSALWYLGGGYEGIADAAQRLIAPITQWTLDTTPSPDPDPEPDPNPGDTWQETVWNASIVEQQEQGLALNPSLGLQKLIAARDGFAPVTAEASVETPGGVYGFQAAEHLETGDRIVLAFRRPWSGPGDVSVLSGPAPDPEPEPEPEPEPFAFRAWPTDHRIVTQTYGNNPAYYVKFGLLGHEGVDIRAPMGDPVYVVDEGVVSDMRDRGDDGHPYGRFVRVAHAGGYETTYAHLQSIGVQLGQMVQAGDRIARADNTGNIVSGSSHLHLTLKRDGEIVDPTPFLLPHRPSFPGLPPAEHGVTVVDISRHQNLKDENGAPSDPVHFEAMMRRGAHACYVRGSIGAAGLDDAFVMNWQAIAETPLLRGMYHLFRSNTTAEANLANIVRAVQEYGAGDLRIAIDVEPVDNERVDGDKVARFLPMFRDEFGYAPLVYTGLWILNPKYSHGDMSWMASAQLWLASFWNAPPQTGQYPQLPVGGSLDRLLAHQWTSSYHDGRKWGVASKGLDLNVVYDLRRLQVEGVAPDPPPEPGPPPSPPPAETIDLLPYFLPVPGGKGPLYELRRRDGSQERVQVQHDGAWFYITKGTGGRDGKSEWEQLRADDEYIWRGIDTSPGGGRFYVQREPGQDAARWCKRHMAIGETWTGPGHHVQFYDKQTCEESTPNSGPATNQITLVARHDVMVFLNGVSLIDVVELAGSNGERWWFARSYGMVAWSSPWGASGISEIHAPGARPDNVRETIC